MLWNHKHYPQAMAHLTREVREKAIQMANHLRQEYGFKDEHAIALAISRAEIWARRQGLISSPGSRAPGPGATGHDRVSGPTTSTPPPPPGGWRMAA